MKLRLKYFGIGLIVAGLLFTLNNLYPVIDSGLTEGSPVSLHKKEKEVKELKAELAKLKKENEALKEKQAKVENQDSTSNQDNNSEATNSGKNADEATEDSTSPNEDQTATVLIYEGMTLYEIGQQVEDLGLLENGRTLELYLSKPDYAKKIQKGQFELSSSMTIEEMAKLLTGQQAQ